VQLAQDIMNVDPPHCVLETPVKTIIKRFSEEQLTGMLVVDDQQGLCGIITESDLVEQQAKLHVPTAIALFDMILPLGEERFEQELQRLQALEARDLMVENIVTVSPDDSLATIASLMSEVHIHHLPVIEGDSVVGVISRHDVVKALAAARG